MNAIIVAINKTWTLYVQVEVEPSVYFITLSYDIS